MPKTPEGGIPPGAEFEAPIEEKKLKPIEVSAEQVNVLGVEIPRNKERGPRVPNADNFKKFSEDKFSLDLLQRIAKSEALDQPLLLEGEAAVGKSYTIEYLAHLANREVYRMSLNGQTDTTDLIGKWVPRTEGAATLIWNKIQHLDLKPESLAILRKKKTIEVAPGEVETLGPKATKVKISEEEEITLKQNFAFLTKEEMGQIARLEGVEVPEGEWVWQDGDIPKQMANGAWSVLDEVNTCEPQILVRLNALLERGGRLVLHEDGSRIVPRHENFRLFATVNPPGGRYKGRVPLSAEWISRWNYQNIGDLPKEVRALRLMTAEGVVPPEIKPEELKFLTPERVPEERTLADYYGQKWVKDLFTKYAEFAVKAREMVEKSEIAKEQHQIFDFDQRDDGRFREYLRRFREAGKMTEVIKDALEYCFYNKIKDPKDRKKLKDVAERLIQVQEPKEILPKGEEEMRKKLQTAKAELAGMGIKFE